MRILVVGDVVGRSGRNCLRDMLPKIKSNYKIDFIIANGENLAGGKGITKKNADEIYSYGVNVITSGNHIWDNKNVFNFINEEKRLLRPLNYPEKTTPGRGNYIYNINNTKVAVINICGTIFMPEMNSPFTIIEDFITEVKKETPLIIVDFHAEATSEKTAMGYFLDGKVTAVLGTHTHVQTADERILSNDTAYITDVGMTGSHNSIIGAKKEAVIKKFTTQMPARFEVSNENPCILNAVIVSVEANGKATSIERLFEYHSP